MILTLRLTLLVTTLAAGFAFAQPEVAAAAPTPSFNRWGLELETIQPFFPTINIIRVRASYALWGQPGGLRGDLLLGIELRPNIVHDVVERISEYQIGPGYRQYFWKGLHAEVSLDVGLAWGTNRFDGQFYRTATVFLNTNVGYRFAFFEPGGFFEGALPVGLFIMPQGGLYTSLGVANIGPRGGKPDIFPQANLLIGVSF